MHASTSDSTPRSWISKGSAALASARRSLLAAAALTAALAGPALAHPAPGDYVYNNPGPNVMLDYKYTAEVGEALALQPDGMVVVAGNRSQGAGPAMPPRAFVWRGWPWNARDAGFGGGDGVVELEDNSRAEGVAVQQDGKIVVAGNIGSSATVWRLERDGSPDLGFGNSGKVQLSNNWSAAVGLALQADGTIVIAGHVDDPFLHWNWAAWKLEPVAGAFDPGFGWNGQVVIEASGFEYTYAMTLQPDDKILIAGLQSSSHGSNATVLRLLPDGALDRTFDNGGVVARFSANAFPTIEAIAMAPDGKIVLGGGTGFTGPGSTSDFDAYVARLRPNGGDGSIDGALDPAFNSAGIQPIPQLGTGTIAGLAVEKTGRIVAVGRLTHDQFYQTPGPHGAVYRINVDGTIDSGFYDLWNNPVDYRPIDELLVDTGLAAVAIAPNGNVIITGWNTPKNDNPGREGGVDARALLITLRGGEATPQ